MVPGSWKVFALSLVLLLGVLEGGIEWGINNKVIKNSQFYNIIQELKDKGLPFVAKGSSKGDVEFISRFVCLKFKFWSTQSEM